MYPNFNYIKRHFLFLANKTDKAMDAKLYNVSFNQHHFFSPSMEAHTEIYSPRTLSNSSL